MVLGKGVFTWRGWIGAAILFPTLVAACLGPPSLREGDPLELALDLLGWVVLGCGIFVRLWATLYLGGRKSITLVHEGPYAVCRHPLYWASFLIIVSLAFFIKSIVLALVILLIALVYVVSIIPSEEKHAIDCFGASYRDYCQATPRLIPRLRNLKRPGFVEVKVAAVLREFARDFGCIMLAAGTELLGYCRVQPWWPNLPHLP